MNIFSGSHICKTYPDGFLKSTRKVVLTDISLQVKQHEIFGIIGLNGAGKSSLLKIFMGFSKPDSGTATIAGHHPANKKSHQKIGYLPEHPSLYPHLSITEHLQFGCRIAGITRQKERKRIQNVLETVDLVDVEKIPIKNFSKGMTQRAALAYTILLEPEILILDEPMSGLDPLGRQLVLDIIQNYQQRGATVLFCSHILTDVERICDRIGIMHQGKMETVVEADSLDKNYILPANKASQSPLEHYFLNTIHSEKQ